MDGSYNLFALIGVPLLLFIMWVVFGPIAKVSEKTAEAFGKEKNSNFAVWIFFVIIFLLLVISTAVND
jgi:hypothetical protein